MKKIIALLICAAMTLSLSACGNNDEDNYTGTTAKTTQSTTLNTSDNEEDNAVPLKTGMCVINSLASSKSASEDSDGKMKAESTFAAVLVDSDGKVVQAQLDCAESETAISITGEIDVEGGTEFKSKGELGDNYGMKAASGIDKEWYEQAEACCNFIIGKTQNEIADISLDESGRPADADLASGCTIKVGAIKEAFVKACESASDMGAKQGDELKIAITTVASASSKSASEDGNGSVEIDSEFCALTLDKSGIISSILVDSSQGEVEFDLGGIIVTDVTKPYPTKKEEGDEYGMKAASAIGKEWYEQAKAIEQYAKGLTVQKLSDTPFENQKPAPDSDLASGCTMKAEGIILNAVKAANS